MNVFVTGGTGFVGRAVIDQLIAAEHQVRALVRSKKAQLAENVEPFVGDIADPESLADALNDCEAVIHLIGIIREFPKQGITFNLLHTDATRNILAVTEKQGIKRFLHMSANGTREGAATGYHQTKWAAEQLVRESSLDWTIFRPSLIFGPQDQFVNMLAELIRKLPVTPVMGDGNYRLQPVSGIDVATGFCNALTTPESIKKTYLCGGPEAFSYNDILDLIGNAMGKKSVCKLHHPLFLMKPVVKAMQSIPQFPMTSDQLQMLLEENICDPSEWQQDLDLELIDFKSGIAEYIR